jgi:hypothetical protein
MNRRWAAGLAVVALGWLASPGAVPVYDGVGAPDEPYRYVGKSPAPSSATAAVSVSGGTSAAIQVRSTENGPQALLDLASGAFAAPTDFSLTVTPLAPDTAPPRGQTDGNVYRIAVTAGATLRPDDAQGYLFLRAAVMTKPAPVIAYRATPTDPWVEQTTHVNGRDNVNTPFRKVGDYVVVRLPGSTPLDQSGLDTTRLVVLVAGLGGLVLLTVLVLRRRGDVS